ncbi:hypothetical protein F4861DRAFT_426409 [Xylaria intraflava]|nr:hypothetical protein F4861DRAFT_426409 [Xylaria intraflava]
MEDPWPEEFNYRWNFPENSLTGQGRNTYLLYLECQTKFTTWLVEAAAALGEYPKDDSSAPPSSVIVPFDELYHLADVVSHRGTVCRKVLDCLDFMLKVRGHWDPKNEKEKAQTRDEAALYHHTAAMQDLRAVRNRFELARITSISRPHNQAHRNTSFCWGINCTCISAPSEPTQPKTTYTLPALVGEGFFAWVCFFNDLFVIRSYLKRYWYDYTQSFETLTTRALVTNTAIRMIRANCKAQMRATAHLPGVPQDSSNIVEWICRGITGQFSDTYTFWGRWENYEASWCCYEAQTGLKDYRERYNDKGRPMASKEHMLECARLWKVWPDFGEHRSIVARQFTQLLSDNLSDMRQDAKRAEHNTGGSPFFPCLDEITRGWFQLARRGGRESKSRPIPLWLTVAFQIWIDIKATLRDYAPTAFADLKLHSEHLAALLQKYQDHAITRTSCRTDSTNKPNSSEFLRLVSECWKKNKWADVVARAEYESRTMPGHVNMTCDSPDFFLLEHHLILSGTQLWWAERNYRLFEHWAVKLHRSITPAALLYMAMRTAGLIGIWEDMDYVCE